MKGLVRHFSPAWFAAVMGTGGFANVLYQWGARLSALRWLAVGLVWLNLLMFILLLIPWTMRWFTHFDRLKEDLHHPVMGNFFVTMPVGVIIIGTNATLMGGAFLGKPLVFLISLVAWLVGAAGALVFGVYGSFVMMRAEQTPAQMMNFSWLISPVASIVVPLIGNPLVSMLKVSDPFLAKTVLLINLSFFGLGFLLFLFIGGIIFTRLAQHPLPPAPMAPTFWITLGPIGVGTVSLMGLADSMQSQGMLGAVDTVYLFATALWGLGLWAIGVAILITGQYYKHNGIPFSLSWWAFIFPLAAYSLASLKVAAYFTSPLATWYAGLVAALLAVLWTISFVRTLTGSLNGGLFQPPQQPRPAA